MESPRKFLAGFSIGLLPLMAILIGDYVFLDKSGELLSDREAARLQQSGETSLLGPALRDLGREYSLELVSLRQPTVVALGSSRVLQLHQEMFDQPFVNLGRTISDIDAAGPIVDAVLARHRPELMIIGLDFWWFGATDLPAREAVEPSPPHFSWNLDTLFTPVRWFVERRLSPADYLHVLRRTDRSPFIGVKAYLQREGRSPDGSMRYTGTQLGLKESEDRRFANTLFRIETGANQFAPCPNLVPARLEALNDLRRRLRDGGIKAVYFLPGVAPEVRHRMEARGRYACVNELKRHLAALPWDRRTEAYFDLYDMAEIGVNECEFIDGFHAGAPAHARMLLEMARREDALLKPYLNESLLRDMVRKAAGMTMLPNTSFHQPEEREVDFLGLGCRKG